MVHELPEGTVTVLVTDVEGSIDLTARQGDEAAQEILRTQRGLVRQQVEEHSGHEVKSLGDGFMVAFASARRAVACAAGIQRALAVHNSRQPPEAGAGAHRPEHGRGDPGKGGPVRRSSQRHCRDRWWDQRPPPELARYRAPIDRLYLCNQTCHPGSRCLMAVPYNLMHILIEDGIAEPADWWYPSPWYIGEDKKKGPAYR